IDLSRVDLPAYVFATHDDHIVPWRSAFRTTSLLGRRPTFVLGAAGHIAGVINPAEMHRRHYWIGDHNAPEAAEWFGRAQRRPGSWWPHWCAWLGSHAGALTAAPTAAGNASHPRLEAAPGRYVLRGAD